MNNDTVILNPLPQSPAAQPLNITMVGTGYVGLVTGICLAELGAIVTCVDLSAPKIAALNQGEIPIFEPGLQPLLLKNQQQKKISFTTDLSTAVPHADIVFIAVGTPTDPQTGEANLQFVFDAAEEIGRCITSYTVIVTKSTVPVGTNRKIKECIRAVTDVPFDVASNPEFLREGSAVYDFMHPDRVIIGTETPRAQALMTCLYDPLCDEGIPRMRTGLETAEMIKYGANAFLATKIGFINELADLCEVTGADVREVAKGMGMDKRIGRAFLQTGPGYGGSCFPKDTLALQKTAENHDISLKIVTQVIAANKQRFDNMFARIVAVCDGTVTDKIIGILGLTFKANTDDTRESPAMEIIQRLLDAGAYIQAFDPKGTVPQEENISALTVMPTGEAVAQKAHAVVVLTEWAAFTTLDFSKMCASLSSTLLDKEKPLLDFRNILDPEMIRQAGFRYIPLGYTVDPLHHAQIALVNTLEKRDVPED